MNADLCNLLYRTIQPNGKLMEALYRAAQANLRATIMRSITGNPKLSKSKCGANSVFEALCAIAGTTPELSSASRETELVKWIKANQPTEH